MDERTLGERGAENNLTGKLKDLGGKVKDAVGGLTGDSSLQAEGKGDQLEGKIQDKVGDLQRGIDRKL